MMLLAPNSESGPSLMLVEVGLTLIAVAASFCIPQFASSWYSRIERAFARLAQRKRLSVAVTGAAVLLVRLAILPFCPIPLPFVHDDFSFLLAANTFALGRLTNPTPVMWKHFESFQITMQPSYMSMYFPAQGLVLAAGKVFFGNSWFGLLCVTALMCAAICWMLQAWLPPTWALLGGLLAVLRLGLFSYWINTYSGGGSVAALGGALVLGALPRLMRATRFRDGILLATGIVLIALSRPLKKCFSAFQSRSFSAAGSSPQKIAHPLPFCFAALCFLSHLSLPPLPGWDTTTIAPSEIRSLCRIRLTAQLMPSHLTGFGKRRGQSLFTGTKSCVIFMSITN